MPAADPNPAKKRSREKIAKPFEEIGLTYFYYRSSTPSRGSSGWGRGAVPKADVRPSRGVIDYMLAPTLTAEQYWAGRTQVVMHQLVRQGARDVRHSHGLGFLRLSNIKDFVSNDHQFQRVMGPDGRLASCTFPGCTKEEDACKLVGCLLDRLSVAMYGPTDKPMSREVFGCIPRAMGEASGASVGSSVMEEMCWPWVWSEARSSKNCSISTIGTEPKGAYLRVYLGRAPPEQVEASAGHAMQAKPRRSPRRSREAIPKERGDGLLGTKHKGLEGVHITASRLLCWLFQGPPPSRDHEAAHECHHTWCLQHAHLSWKTHQQNMRMCEDRAGPREEGEWRRGP